MTADLLLAPVVPAAEPETPATPAAERITCQDCFRKFPPAGVEFYEPRQEWLCLDDLDGELLDAEDRRAFFNYRHGR